MKIENNLLELSKVLFNKKENWSYVTDEQKEQFFFIFNRYFSRKYPHLSQLINDKSIDKTIGLDLWFYFMKDKTYPQWFWPKSKKITKSNDEVLLEELRFNNQLTEQEFNFILENYPNEVDEEINYLKLQKNGNSREKLVHNKSTK